MGKEIEHKYLVNDNSFISLASSCYTIKQGYICREKERTVRIRIKDEKAFITIKGITHGDTRDEYEYPIPLNDANMLLNTLCIKPIIEKKRYIVNYNDNKWEIGKKPFQYVIAYRRHFFCKSTTFSTCCVCGNMSTG